MFHESNRSLYMAFIKVVLYSLFSAAILLLFTMEARYHNGPDLFNEESWTENFQFIILALSTLFLILSGKKNPDDSAIATLMAGMTTIAMIRECDAVLDIDVFDGAWQTGAAITALCTFALVYRKKDKLVPGIMSFMKRPSFGYFVCGFITVFVYSRLFGRYGLWLDIMGHEHIVRAVKNAAEEGTELFGYSVLFIACVEFFLESLSRKKVGGC
ncbi:MAG: hypothetical protein WC799_07645 [Desulfobacteraceae bacterium]